MHKEIFQLCYHTKGSFPWDDVYNMPVFLRRFYIKELNDIIMERNKEIEKAQKGGSRQLNRPNISP